MARVELGFYPDSLALEKMTITTVTVIRLCVRASMYVFGVVGRGNKQMAMKR